MKRTYRHRSPVASDDTGVYPAGRHAPPGEYQNVETGRIVAHEQEGPLPASCDGRRAIYMPQPLKWGAGRRPTGGDLKDEIRSTD